MSTIQKIKAREVLDSRANPTIEVDVITQDGIFRAMVPSGASTGIHEALELRDNDPARYHGKGVLKAIAHVHDIIAPALIGKDPTKQAEIDSLMCELDGTHNKSKLGANAILGVSIAVCKAGAAANRLPWYKHIAQIAGTADYILPVPSFNVINGGEHAGNKLAVQEFMILPLGADSFEHALRMGAETYHTLKKVIQERYGLDATNVGDEGGFAPSIDDTKEALDLLVQAIDKAGYTGKIKIGMDIAASEFFKDGMYDLNFKGAEPDRRSGHDMISLYKELIADYPIVSIEDPFDQDDWDNFKEVTKEVGESVQIVGDDLLVTNPEKIAAAKEKAACNALLLKINQIGSITQAIKACKDAQAAGWGVMVSHRSGETEDPFIADIAVGLRAGQIKTGAPCRSERLSKYNQLLRIEEELGPDSRYAGEQFKRP